MLIKTQPTDLGYLLLDHRATDAPAGLPPVFEAATYTCTHCNAVVVLNPKRTRERYKCVGCNHLICDPCAAERHAGAPCKTALQKFDEFLAQAERRAEANPLILP